jgi:hypothetical protein
MQLPLAPERRRPRVDRREAASILQCSRDNIRRLDKIGELKTGKQDRNGAFTYDRGEIEAMARKRGLHIKPGGELAARVFAMFEERLSFAKIVIATQQDPEVILGLWQRYRAGFDGPHLAPNDDTRERAEHEAQMRAFETEQQARRRAF